MGLYDRLTGRPGEDQDGDDRPSPAPDLGAASNGARPNGVGANGVQVPSPDDAPAVPAPLREPERDERDEYLADIRRRTHLALVKAMGPALYDPNTSDAGTGAQGPRRSSARSSPPTPRRCRRPTGRR